MPNRERRVERARWLIGRDLEQLGLDLRTARLASGLTLRRVASATGVSAQTVLRCERPGNNALDPVLLAGVAATVGMRVRIKAYPEGLPIRDAGQVALIREFRDRIGAGLTLKLEQPIAGVTGDLRAFEATLDLAGGRGVEFITRFHDCQAQLRAAMLKQRDAGVARLIIVVQATNANRRAVAAAADILEDTFPLGTRATLTALTGGRDPGANALVLI